MEKQIFVENEEQLSATDRLGLAWCRLNCWQWDNILGPKPMGFDDLPEYPPKKRLQRLCKRTDSKHDIVAPAIKKIEELINTANTSRCWWEFVLKRPKREWYRWYFSGLGLTREQLAECVDKALDADPDWLRQYSTAESGE